MKIVFRLFLVVTLIISNQLISTGNNLLSAYQQELIQAKGDKKVDILNKISQLYFDEIGNIDSMLQYAELAETLAKKLNYKDGELKAGSLKVLGWARIGEMEKAEKYLNSILNEESKIKNLNIKGDIFYIGGFLNYLLDKNDVAINYYLKAIDNYKAKNNFEILAMVYCRIGAVFSIQNQLEDCLKYVSKAKSLLPKIKTPFYICSINNTLSGLYNQISVKYPIYIDTSIQHAQKALKYVDKYGYYTKGAQLSISIASAYNVKKEYLKSIEFAKKSLEYRTYMFDYDFYITYANFTDCYINLGEFEKASIYFDSLLIANKESKDLYYQSETAERGYFIYKNLGQTDKALKYLEIWKQSEDSLQNNDKLSRINELEKKFNKVEDEKKIQKLSLEKETLAKKNELDQLNIRLLIFSIIIALLIIAIIVFFYRQSILKNKFREIEIEQRLNRARINPHFFFNALVSVQELSLTKDRQNEVPIYLSRYAKIMRMTLESSYNELVKIEDEIIFLEEYISIQQLRFPNKFEYTINCPDEIYDFLIPSMILQPFIENSVEYGFKNHTDLGKLSIDFIPTQNDLIITIHDNGNASIGSVKNYPSRASEIISDRLLLLNKKHKTNAHFKVIENSELKGYTVKITLPLLNQE
jgi:sensor histidine kinase YesM